ncbi:Smr/MutS family protein [Sphingomonas sp. HHU CXW]|uniref:Smr/MutS family protein n=1 Tax=Sphingomonas hominis TaxID=2741495 RepID=A0ABX2JGS6_9SPHN|nr:Smr/MutS family protein [Sphingomonas hominis]NTS65810.1 Smr/MutS family protein [Sphingomonas hominis]
MGRRLAPEETSAWAQVRATVRPLRPEKLIPIPIVGAPSKPVKAKPAPPTTVQMPPPARVAAPLARATGNTLDRSWDRKLSTGMASPDRTIDLHGHTLASAHAMLDYQLDQSIRQGERMILLVTGRLPRKESERPHARGAIRAAIGDWLQLSRHADMIAAVRNAHPRHGGAGALYVILRRKR